MLQVVGRKGCQEARKVLRWLKERSLEHQFVDLDQRALSPGELESVLRSVSAEDLVDTSSKSYRKRGLAHMVYDPVEELAEDPSLMKTPILRNKGKAALGFDEAFLKEALL